MTLNVTHTFVDPVVDQHDPNKVGPDEWNAAHTITGTLSLAQGGLGDTQAAATVNQVPVYPGSGGAAVPSSTLSLLGITINPTGPSLNKGFVVNQNGGVSGTAPSGDIIYNSITVSPETSKPTTSNNHTTPLSIGMSVGGANAFGHKYGSYTNVVTFAPAVTSGDYIGAVSAFRAAHDNGGTNTGVGAHGGVYGFSSIGSLGGAALNYGTVEGAEFDVAIHAGASSAWKFGIGIVNIGEFHGDVLDSAIEIGSANTGGSFKAGILLNTAHGGYPLDLAAKFITTDGVAQTIGSFVDFTGVTVSTDIFRFTNFSVTGAGALSASSVGASGLVQAGATIGFFLGGNVSIIQGGNYTNFKTSNAVTALAAGNASDPTNYYGNDTHTFRSAAASLYGTWGSTGITATGISINPPAASITKGILVTQTGPLSGSSAADVKYNSIGILNDEIDATGFNVYGLNVAVAYGGANAKGSRFAIQGITNLAYASANTGNDTVGVVGSAISPMPNGGTNTGAGAAGTLYGLYGTAHGFSGAINYYLMTGAEFTAQVDTGATTKHRWGVSLIGSGAVRGAATDAAFAINAGNSSNSYNTGMLLGNIAGAPGISTGGTVIGSDGSTVTVTNFASLPTYTFSGNIFNFGTLFTVSGAGNLVATTLRSLGTVQALDTTGYLLGANTVLLQTGAYTKLITTNANAFLAGGNASDPTNFYTNDTHTFRNAGGSIYGIWGSAGITSGVVSSLTGALNLANAGSAFLTTIQAGVAAAARTYIWPTNFGAAGTVLTDAAGNGILSWTTVSGGGGGITALTGDVTASGTGSVAATLTTTQPTVHTWTLAQTFTVAPIFTDQAGSRTALGLGTAAVVNLGTGVATALAVNVGTAGAFVVNGGVLGTPSSGTLTNATGLPTTSLTGFLQAAQFPAISGDVASSAGGLGTTIQAGVVTLAKMANMATASLIYRRTAATGVPEVNTLTQLKLDLGLTGTNSGDQTITLTGDVTGAGTGSFATTLASTITAGGPIGSATVAPIITYDVKGRLTLVSSATITPAVGSITGLGTGIATALAVNVGTAGAPVILNGALGTPSSGTLTNCTGLPSAGLAADVFSTAHSWSGPQTFTGGTGGTNSDATIVSTGRVEIHGKVGDTSAVIEFTPQGLASQYLFVNTAALLTFSGGAGLLLTGAAAALQTQAPAGGVGYATGAGSTGTQITSKATTVVPTKNCVCGAITMNAAALAAGAIVSFAFTNTSIAVTDVMILNHISGGTVGAYTLNAQCAAGSATINVCNNTAGSLSEAIVIQFVIIKGVNA